MNMIAGGNARVPTQSLVVRVLSGVNIDVSAFRLFADGKVQGDPDMVFYGQPINDDQSICLSGEGVNTAFTIDLPKLRTDVEKIAFAVTCNNNQIISQLKNLSIQIELDGNILMQGVVDIQGRSEAALILGELYRRNAEWKFRFVAQGFNGGLKPLAEHFGVEVDNTPEVTPTPEPAKNANKVNLNKVSLTKTAPAISLTKQDNFGEIRINLNWHRSSSAPGFFQGIFGSNRGVDLDLGAFIELRDGNRSVVQALGNAFGSYQNAPYVQLQGDDRTGDIHSGEWLHINGYQWQQLKEVMIYAFIYEGVPSWESTDAIVNIHVPGQPPIETRLTEGNNRKNMCAIARLVNESGTIKVERINRFFSGHKEMDEALGWGFQWRAGSK